MMWSVGPDGHTLQYDGQVVGMINTRRLATDVAHTLNQYVAEHGQWADEPDDTPNLRKAAEQPRQFVREACLCESPAALRDSSGRWTCSRCELTLEGRTPTEEVVEEGDWTPSCRECQKGRTHAHKPSVVTRRWTPPTFEQRNPDGEDPQWADPVRCACLGNDACGQGFCGPAVWREQRSKAVNQLARDLNVAPLPDGLEDAINAAKEALWGQPAAPWPQHDPHIEHAYGGKVYTVTGHFAGSSPLSDFLTEAENTEFTENGVLPERFMVSYDMSEAGQVTRTPPLPPIQELPLLARIRYSEEWSAEWKRVTEAPALFKSPDALKVQYAERPGWFTDRRLEDTPLPETVECAEVRAARAICPPWQEMTIAVQPWYDGLLYPRIPEPSFTAAVELQLSVLELAQIMAEPQSPVELYAGVSAPGLPDLYGGLPTLTEMLETITPKNPVVDWATGPYARPCPTCGHRWEDHDYIPGFIYKLCTGGGSSIGAGVEDPICPCQNLAVLADDPTPHLAVVAEDGPEYALPFHYCTQAHTCPMWCPNRQQTCICGHAPLLHGAAVGRGCLDVTCPCLRGRAQVERLLANPEEG